VELFEKTRILAEKTTFQKHVLMSKVRYCNSHNSEPNTSINYQKFCLMGTTNSPEEKLIRPKLRILYVLIRVLIGNAEKELSLVMRLTIIKHQCVFVNTHHDVLVKYYHILVSKNKQENLFKTIR